MNAYAKLLADRTKAPTRAEAIKTLEAALRTIAKKHGRTVAEHFDFCEHSAIFDEECAKFHSDYMKLSVLLRGTREQSK